MADSLSGRERDHDTPLLIPIYDNKPASKLFLFSVSEDTDRGVSRGLCPHKPLVITHFNKIDSGSL
ncbi:hypothetical protein SAMN04487894_11540 [Niabella drilacis]|uniref:Uncharacterized protein n=1 Tax=Niabella drilacis (strain DSM 25811 / CCM 8410 / CCUG 62505 / LMG 26954 / E90) TaxID=1285928 RepID=A0A1G6YA35_NIADE|nr:hypothetical protein SAMN04487894_11540 [Niabella drilacis]